MKLRLKVASDQLVCEEIVRKKAGSIIIPDTATDKDRTHTIRCRVLAMGPGTLHVSDDGKRRRLTVDDLVGHKVKVGDVILISKFTHTIEDDSRKPDQGKLRIVKADQVLCVEG